MREYVENRAKEVAAYILEHKATIRSTAKVFGVCKSTIHKDVRERLPEINPIIAKEVKKILDYNASVRHIRGGKATHNKYKS